MTELRQLQALFYLARDVRLDGIYQANSDNRRIRHSMEQLESDWAELDSAIEGHDKAHPIHAMHRDGHCHEAVMWYVARFDCFTTLFDDARFDFFTNLLNDAILATLL